MTTQELKDELKNRGYYTDDLWHINDVQCNFKCTDEEAYRVLDMALTNPSIVGDIFSAIDDAANYLELN